MVQQLVGQVRQRPSLAVIFHLPTVQNGAELITIHKIQAAAFSNAHLKEVERRSAFGRSNVYFLDSTLVCVPSVNRLFGGFVLVVDRIALTIFFTAKTLREAITSPSQPLRFGGIRTGPPRPGAGPRSPSHQRNLPLEEKTHRITR